MKKIVFSDVDGTLLNSNHEITSMTQKAIKRLEEQEIPFVIVSARSPSGIYPILKEYDFRCTAIIAYSGALILDEHRNILYHKGIHKENARQIIQYIETMDMNISWCAYSLDQWVVKDKTDPKIIEEETIVKAKAEEGSIDTIIDSQVNKILCICDPSQILQIETKLKEVFPRYSIVKSYDNLLEIMENSITKAEAVKNLCSLWNISLNNAIAFGDNYNDVEMLKTVGIGYLMDNAPKDLKEQGFQVTKDNDHDGIYYALSGLGWI